LIAADGDSIVTQARARHPKEAPVKQLLSMAALCIIGAAPAFAQDPVKVDPKHYTVEFENEQVRVLRIRYGAGEKSVMHEHPAAVAVFLTDGQVKFTRPDGKTQLIPAKAGGAVWNAAGKHLPENVGDKPFELILVELKGKPTTGK
jgi:quercetin dioxygenase-like cupin family protein